MSGKGDLGTTGLTDYSMVKLLHWKQRLHPEVLIAMVDFDFTVFGIVETGWSLMVGSTWSRGGDRLP